MIEQCVLVSMVEILKAFNFFLFIEIQTNLVIFVLSCVVLLGRKARLENLFPLF